jgi:hypothetical protein
LIYLPDLPKLLLMKKLIQEISIAFTLLLLSLPTSAQSFAPLGAEWCYHADIINYGNVGIPQKSWTDHLLVEKDTIVGSKACRKVLARRDERIGNGPLVSGSISKNLFIYDNVDTVFIYSETLQSFVPLYILSASEQDTICLPVPEPAFTQGVTEYCFVVDSIRTEEFDNVPLKSFYTRALYPDSATSSVNFGRFQISGLEGYNLGKYTEQLGGTWPLISGWFPSSSVHSWHLAVRPGFPSGSLSQYTDPLTAISLSPHDCDTVLLPVDIRDGRKQALSLNLSPNPSQGEVIVHFTSALSQTGTFTLIDNAGRKLQTWKAEKGIKNLKLQLNDVSTGIYFLELSLEGSRTIHKLVVSGQ